MRRVALSVLVVLPLVGCGGDTGFYDAAARDVAKQAVRNGPFDNAGDKVSVGSVEERRKCPQAPSADAGPCLDVEVTSEGTARAFPGTRSPAEGATIRVTFDAFVWLKKTPVGWKVTYKTYRPKGAALDGVPYRQD